MMLATTVSLTSMLEISLVVIGLLLYTSRADNGSEITSIASSTSADTDVQVYFQDSTGRLQYRLASAGVWQNASRVIPVTDQPKANTPLAGIAWQDSDNLNLRLYYLNSNSKIVEAQGTCSGFVCNWVNNVVSNVTALSTSGLAAAWLGSNDIRVYYLSSTSYVSELAEANGWSSGATVGPQAYSSSSLAVSAPNGIVYLQVYYLSPDMALSQIEYDNGWSQGTIIQTGFGSKSNASFAAIAQTNPSTRSLYYINETKAVNELQYQNNAWLSTTQSPSSVLEADTAAGPIAAVAWTSNINLYYVAAGDIVEEKSEGNNQWTLGSYSTPNATSIAAPTAASNKQLTSTNKTRIIAGATIGGVVLIIFVIIIVIRVNKHRA